MKVYILCSIYGTYENRNIVDRIILVTTNPIILDEVMSLFKAQNLDELQTKFNIQLDDPKHVIWRVYNEDLVT